MINKQTVLTFMIVLLYQKGINIHQSAGGLSSLAGFKKECDSSNDAVRSVGATSSGALPRTPYRPCAKPSRLCQEES
jgi:hypothetical protein